MSLTRALAGCLLGLLFGILSTAAALAASEGDVVWVTDELRLGLFSTEETQGRAKKTLLSGARLTVLERALMSIRVRTDDGEEGWVKTAYIVEVEPARSRLVNVEAEAEATLARLDQSEGALAAASTRVEELTAELADANAGIVELPALREENQALKAELNAVGIKVSITWLLVAVLISILVGGLVGYWLLDRRVRSRFGGLRLY
jgi:ABC-type antimicrobial peptide transport system permease subunit